MKNFSLLFLSLLLFSCSEKESKPATNRENVLENFSYSVDTVVVDPGDEIINLTRGVSLASLNESKTHYYLLDENIGQVQKINLDALVWEENIPFEKEGPNGIGTNYHTKALVFPNEDFLFTSFQVSGIFSKEGMLKKEFKLKKDNLKINGLEEQEATNLTSQFTLSDDQKTAFSLPGDFIKGTRKLLKIDLENSTGEIIPIPAMDISSQYHIVLEVDEMGLRIYSEPTYIQKFGTKIYLVSQTTNKIYHSDFRSDSLQLLEYNFTLVPNQKEIPVQNNVKSKEEFDIQMEKALSQINFERLIYDETTERFFRFGRIHQPQTDSENNSTKVQAFLFAFDKNLNLIGETEIIGLETLPTYPFFKDGKLWSYVNVEDELGFAVFTFDF